MSASTVDEIDASVSAALGSGVLATSYQFTGDGTTVDFTLAGGITDIPNSQSIIATIDGVTQHTDTYSVSGKVVTFSTAPPLNGDIQVRFNAYLGTANDASAITYNQGGTGASSRTVENKLQESVSVKDFGAVGDGVTDDTATIQAAIDTDKNVVFSEGSYMASGLTVNNNQQCFTAVGGNTKITKNANGTIISGSGDDLYFGGIDFRGNASSYTGDNISLTGNRITFTDNCGSSDAAGRALKATGGAIRIYGGHNTWATTATGVSDYDIEIGVSGTATLYHYLTAIRTGHSDGGILLVDCGSQTVIGCQIGKLNISKGTGPSGTNGGMVVSNRVLGNVTVGLSNCNLIGNQFSSSSTTLAFLLGTSQCYYMGNSSPLAITNAGNVNNHIYREVSSGSINEIKLGPDTNTNYIKINDPDHEFSGHVTLQNNKALKIKDSAGTLRNAIALSSGDDWTIGTGTGANFMNIGAGSGGIYLVVDGASRFQATPSSFRPHGDNAHTLGTSSQRFSVVYAGTGTINTSDEREKTELLDLDLAELSVAKELKGAIKKFKFNDAVKAKGDGARIHVGVGAQTVKSIFESHGLVAEDYALFCYDEWDAEDAILNDDGTVLKESLAAGNRYGIRYEELLAFIISTL
jgi:hypothetical protein